MKSIRITLLAFIALHAVLILSNALLPFTDLPNHLSEATIFKYQHQASILNSYYEVVPWFYPNTFHMVFCSLFPSVEFGNKVFNIVYIALLLFTIDMIIKELGGNRWYGLLSVLYIYNFNTTWGFTGFAIAIPFTLLLFYFTLLETRTRSLKFTLVNSFLLVALYLMHAQMALFGFLLYFCMMMVAEWKQWKRLLMKVTFVLLPLVVIIVIWWNHRSAEAQEQSTLSFLVHYYKTEFFQTYYKRGSLLIRDHNGLGSIPFAIGCSVLFTLFVFVPLLYYKAWKGVSRNSIKKIPFPLIFVSISLFTYLLLPSRLPGQAPLYERFSTLVFLSVIIFGSILLKREHSKRLPVFVLLACLVYSSVWAENLFKFNSQNRTFSPSFFDNIPDSAKLGGLIYDYEFRGRPVYIHFPNYFLVWKKGPVTSKIIDYRFGIVRRGAKGDDIPYYHEWIGRKYIVPAEYQTSLQFILKRGQAQAAVDSNLRSFQPIRETDSWTLLVNRTLR